MTKSIENSDGDQVEEVELNKEESSLLDISAALLQRADMLKIERLTIEQEITKYLWRAKPVEMARLEEIASEQTKMHSDGLALNMTVCNRVIDRTHSDSFTFNYEEVLPHMDWSTSH